MFNEFKLPEQWLREDYQEYVILDYDGFTEDSWYSPMDRNEFERRLFECTIIK
jgi:hypothetical protein